MQGPDELYTLLNQLGIAYEYAEHPAAPTIAIAKQFWVGTNSKHCKNLFFRNHKGNQHYLVLLDCDCDMNIHAIEKQLHQGKLSFASPERMMKYLGVTPGSVTPFGLINDKEHHVHVFLDKNLQRYEKISFHPCVNTASIAIARTDLIKFLDHMGNPYEWMKVY